MTNLGIVYGILFICLLAALILTIKRVRDILKGINEKIDKL